MEFPYDIAARIFKAQSGPYWYCLTKFPPPFKFTYPFFFALFIKSDKTLLSNSSNFGGKAKATLKETHLLIFLERIFEIIDSDNLFDSNIHSPWMARRGN